MFSFDIFFCYPFVIYFFGVLIFYQYTIAPHKTKKVTSTSASQPFGKILIPVLSSSPSLKKPILAQSLLSKTLPFCRRITFIRDLFKKKIDSRHDKNNNDDKAAYDNFLLER